MVKPDMQYRILGHTGERVSAIGIGGWHIGLPHVDEGINFLDDSWDYNEGASEKGMGKALRDGYRSSAFVMTKIDGRSGAEATRQLGEVVLPELVRRSIGVLGMKSMANGIILISKTVTPIECLPASVVIRRPGAGAAERIAGGRLAGEDHRRRGAWRIRVVQDDFDLRFHGDAFGMARRRAAGRPRTDAGMSAKVKPCI